MQATALILLSQCALLALAAGSAPPGTAETDSPFQPCLFPAFDASLRRFSKAITFETVSTSHTDNHALHQQEFHELWDWAAAEYTEVHQQLQVEQVGAGGLSRLITWQGSDRSLQPVLFVSHVDVVPVTDETVKDWQHPPFSGAVVDGYVWGRGAMDIKGTAVGLLEAATALLREGFQPRRTLLIALGHDEEVGGAQGAGHIAALLTARGVKVAMVWDEGSPVIVGGLVPLLDSPVALVATAEKAYQSVQVTLYSHGGHSSMPATDGSSLAARMGRLLLRIATDHPPAKLVPPTSHFVVGLAAMAPSWAQPLLLLLGRLAPLRWLLARAIGGMDSEVAAMVRMTAAVTNVHAGVAGNVMPQVGTIAINFRLLPGDSSDTIRQQLLHWLGPDAQHADISFTDKWETPTAVTDPDGPHFALVRAAVQEAWRLKGDPVAPSRAGTGGDAQQAAAAAAAAVGVDSGKQHAQHHLLESSLTSSSVVSSAAGPLSVVPYLLCGGTDSKWYANMTDNILRFAPFSVNRRAGDVKRVHGTNERLSVADYERMLCTLRTGMQMAGMHMYLGSEAPAAAAAAAADQREPAGPRNSRTAAAGAAATDSVPYAGTTCGNTAADEL